MLDEGDVRLSPHNCWGVLLLCSETGSFIDGPHNGVQRVLSWCPSNAACSVIFSVKTTELLNGTPDGSMDLALDEFIPFHTGH